MSVAVSANPYIVKNLFGLTCSVGDTSYVAYNLYMRKLRQSTTIATQQHNSKSLSDSQRSATRVYRDCSTAPTAKIGASSSTSACEDADNLGGTCNSDQSAAEAPPKTLSDILCSFVEAVIDKERIPLYDAIMRHPNSSSPPHSQQQRMSRERFLRAHFATPLPSLAESLLDAMDEMNAVCFAVFDRVHTASLQLHGRQPPTRAAQIEQQRTARDSAKSLRVALTKVESALNTINEFDDGEDDEADDGDEGGSCRKQQREALFDKCDVLYTDRVCPRHAAAELLCAMESAIALRTEEVVEYAHRLLRASVVGSNDTKETLYLSSIVVDAAASPLAFQEYVEKIFARSEQEQQAAAVGKRKFGATQKSPAAAVSDMERLLLLLNASQRATLLVLLTETTPMVLRQLDGINHFKRFYEDLRSLDERLAKTSSDEESAELLQSFGVTADALCDALHRCDIIDAEQWLAEKVDLILRQRRQQQLTRGTSQVQQLPSQASPPRRTTSFSKSMGDQRGMSSLGTTTDITSSMSSPFQSLTSQTAQQFGSMLRQGSQGSGTRSALRSLSAAGDDSCDAMLTSGGSGQSIAALMTPLADFCDEAPLLLGNSNHQGIQGVVTKMYDCIGKINLFLKRSGLAHDVRSDDNSLRGGGALKVVPTIQGDELGKHNLFLPHNIDEMVGFTRDCSELYERGCLLLQQLAEQNRIKDKFDALAAMPEDEFFRECHEDLLQSLFEAADNNCVLTESRQAVAKRLAMLMVVRVKILHFNGEVRALTLPQVLRFEEVLQRFNEFWRNFESECELSYMDDDDKVILTTDREYTDLLRMRRNTVLEGLGFGSSALLTSRSGTLSKTTVASSNALKIELFADPKKVPLAVPSASSNAGKISRPPSTGSSSAVSKAPQVPHGQRRDEVPKPPPPPPAMKLASNRDAPLGANIFEALPPNTSLPDYLRSQEGPSMDEIMKMYDRKALAMGIPMEQAKKQQYGYLPPPQLNSKTETFRPSEPLQQPLPPPPVTVAVGNKSWQPTPSASQPPPPTVPPPEEGGGNSKARSLFFAMGKAKRAGDASFATIDPEALSDALGGGQPVPPPPQGSVHVIQPQAHSKWGVPPQKVVAQKPSDGGGFDKLHFAQHSLKGEEAHLRGSVASSFWDDDDDDTPQGPTWNRGTDNHIEAVLRSGGGNLPGGPIRYNAPAKRNAVALPKEASPKPSPQRGAKR